jgi:hypothetical protein
MEKRTTCNAIGTFVEGLTPIYLRRINEQLLRRLLGGWPKDQWGIGLIDATDLPAATSDRAAVPGLLSSEEGKAGTLYVH